MNKSCTRHNKRTAKTGCQCSPSCACGETCRCGESCSCSSRTAKRSTELMLLPAW